MFKKYDSQVADNVGNFLQNVIVMAILGKI